MNIIGDFHLHSKYSRATSPKMDLEHLDEWAKIKGINVITATDFTHPVWFKELREKLEPAEAGLYKLRKNKPDKTKQETRFILTTEISCIYSKNNKTRKIHIIVFAPSLDVVKKINAKLGSIGNIKSDGRPILGLDAKELAKIILNISEDCLIVPAHAWTPWFSIFGSKSGFDSIEECFEEYSKYIYAVETGLSSDPAMNWRLSALDNITLISNSDSHSLPKIGREANVFEGRELNYKSIVQAIKLGARAGSSEKLRLAYTIEFFPEEGKYHYDGHRACDICLSPKESKKYNNLCPACGRPLTVGVLQRVDDLSDREEGFRPKNAIPFKSLIPLEEIISDVLGVGVASKRVQKEYQNMIQLFGNEFKILLEVSDDELQNATLPKIAEGIIKVRGGKVDIEPGYDGVYGKINIFSKGKPRKTSGQKNLF